MGVRRKVGGRQAHERGEPTGQKEKVRGARRKAATGRRLTDEQIIAEAVKIIGKAESATDVASYLDALKSRPTGPSYFSKEWARSDQRVLAWLRRGKVLLKHAHSPLLCGHDPPYASLNFKSFLSEVDRWASCYEDEVQWRKHLATENRELHARQP